MKAAALRETNRPMSIEGDVLDPPKAPEACEELERGLVGRGVVTFE